MSFLVMGSSKVRPIRRLMAKMVFSGLVTAWRFAGWPTRRSPSSVKATIDGVVRAPSAFSMTLGVAPSITATQELVVPRSMPMTLAMSILSFRQIGRAYDERPTGGARRVRNPQDRPPVDPQLTDCAASPAASLAHIGGAITAARRGGRIGVWFHTPQRAGCARRAAPSG